MTPARAQDPVEFSTQEFSVKLENERLGVLEWIFKPFSCGFLANKLREEITLEAYRLMEKIPWVSHPTAEGVRIKPFISEKEHGLSVTCMLVKIPAGKEVAEHIHPNQDDILYPLAGKAAMWVDGAGQFSLEPGIVVRVPKGTKHKIFDVTEELLIYDVFSPALL